MNNSTLDKPLVETEKKVEEKEMGFDSKPFLVFVFLCASIAGMFVSLYNCVKHFQAIPDGITFAKIFKFMVQPIKEDTAVYCMGPLWRIVLFYTYFILVSIVGLLNCIPSVNMALNRKPAHSSCRNVRNLYLGSFLWILSIAWILSIMIIDLHNTKFMANPAFYLYKLSSYTLNLTWTLAIALCTRNTIFQQIYRETYAVLIGTHRIFGTISFWLTFCHIIFAFCNWYTYNKEGYWHFLWHKIWHYAWAEYHWKDVHFTNLGFMIATDWLMKVMFVILLAFLTAIPIIRRKAWEVFYYTHVFVLIAFIYLMVFHSSNIIYYAFIPIVLYVLDKLTRWYTIYAHPCTAVIQAYEGTVFVDVTVTSLFSSTKYRDLVGAVAYINIPEAKFFEYHPMSIAYNEGNHLYFYIRVTGNKNSWTHKLAELANRKSVKAYIEGPYTMFYHKTDLTMAQKEQILKNDYHKNIVCVGGGCGFAGVSSYLKDALRLVKSLPPEQQQQYNIYVVLVVTYHAHIDCMKELLIECKKYDFAHIHLYSTYSGNMELKISSPKGKNANKLEVSSDVEEKELLEFTVARPDMEEILRDLNDEAISAYYCGPDPLAKAFFTALSNQKRPFFYFPEVFDM